MEKRDELIVNAIVEASFEELMAHIEAGACQIWMSPDEKCFDFIGGNRGKSYKEVSAPAAATIIRKTVREHYEKYGKVYLYSCRDNAEISFEEHGNEAWQDDDFMGDPQELHIWHGGKLETIKGKFWIGYD